MAAVPAAIMFALMLRLPESPRWLAREGHSDRAREALARVRHADVDLSGEMAEIGENVKAEKQASTRGWAGLRAAWVRPALVVGCGLAVFTQLSGIEMIVYYTPTILTDNGFSDSTALRVSVALVWIVTGIVSLGIFPVEDSLKLLSRVGIPAPAQPYALYAAAALDIILGMLSVMRRRPRWLWPAQIALVLGYTAIISVRLPEFWLHPYGPILKNLPLLGVLLLLAMLDPQQEKRRDVL